MGGETERIWLLVCFSALPVGPNSAKYCVRTCLNLFLYSEVFKYFVKWVYIDRCGPALCSLFKQNIEPSRSTPQIMGKRDVSTTEFSQGIFNFCICKDILNLFNFYFLSSTLFFVFNLEA